MNQLTKAQLIVESPEGLLDAFDIQFNPTEFTLDKGVQLQDIGIPGLDSPLVQFVRGNAEKLSVDLYFDTTDSGTGSITVPVTIYTDRIYSLVKIEPERHAPPFVTFIWGPTFPGALRSPTTGNQRRHAVRDGLLIQDGGADVEASGQLARPGVAQPGGADNQRVLDPSALAQLGQQQPGLDRLAEPHRICE